MKNITKRYLKTLISSFVVLLTSTLVLLYTIQGNTASSENKLTSESKNLPQAGLEFEQAQHRIDDLERQILLSKDLAKNQRLTHEHQTALFIEKISELQHQLEESNLATLRVLEQYSDTRLIARQLEQQLGEDKLLRLKQNSALLESQAQIQALDQALAQEKADIHALRLESSANKTALLNLSDELVQKKSALVKTRRILAANNQALRAKSRELTISESRVDDGTRRIQSLNQQISASDQ